MRRTMNSWLLPRHRWRFATRYVPARLPKYRVQMVINDNVDVAAALPDHVGLHVGQDDAKLSEARQRLGPRRLIGISVHSPAQAREALDSEADYAGVGPVWPTKSKAGITEEDVLSMSGAREVVAHLARDPATLRSGQRARMPCVLIGGINVRTAHRSLHGATSSQNHPDGVAVISAIVSRRDADVAAKELHDIVSQYFEEQKRAHGTLPALLQAPRLATEVAALLTAHHTRYDPVQHADDASSVTLPRPLLQVITSHVSSNISANMALAFSASPIMSHEATEARDLSAVISALVLNIGTLSPASREGMAVAGPCANDRGVPIVLDPVGAGATAHRAAQVQSILNETQVTLIKGNAAEIGALLHSNEAKAQGVDSVGEMQAPSEAVRRLARQEGALVLMTGKVDYLSDGDVCAEVHGGSALLGRITATGCSLGVVVAAGMAAAKEQYQVTLPSGPAQRMDPPRRRTPLLVGALMSLLAFALAAEQAEAQPHVHGPGTFLPAFLDALASLSPTDVASKVEARVRFV